MDKEFGMQELYFVQLKSTYPIEIKGKEIAAGEVVAAFDKIQISNFKEIQNTRAAQGGYNNHKLMVWDRTEGVDLVFTQGIFSKTQFGLMNNTKLIEKGQNQILRISQRDELETDDEGKATLTHKPADNWIFVYNKETGEKLTNLIMTGEKEIQTPLVYKDVIVDYEYEYDNGAVAAVLGQELFEGYMEFEGRSRIKDDITGETKTMIIHIPKLKITSDMNLTLGQQATPIVGKFTGVALPIGQSHNAVALEIYFLEDDIDKDSEWR